MRVLVAVVVTAVLFVGVAVTVASGPGPGAGQAVPTRLAVPAVGEVHAELLDDGAPVFVVAHDGGSVSVLSAINPHLDTLAVWCADDRGRLPIAQPSRCRSLRV